MHLLLLLPWLWWSDGTCVPRRGFFSCGWCCLFNSNNGEEEVRWLCSRNWLGCSTSVRLGLKYYAVKMRHYVVMPADINRRQWRYRSSLCHPRNEPTSESILTCRKYLLAHKTWTITTALFMLPNFSSVHLVLLLLIPSQETHWHDKQNKK